MVAVNLPTANGHDVSDRPPVALALPSTNETNGRQPNGRFAKGNKGGPGNPHNKQIAAFRRVLYGAVRQWEVRALVRKVYDQAMSGDMAAAGLILKYLIGRPADLGAD
jgi:hypothetical protein